LIAGAAAGDCSRDAPNRGSARAEDTGMTLCWHRVLNAEGRAAVKFRQMKDGDAEDYALLSEREAEHVRGTADRLLKALVELDEGLSGYRVTRLGHSLQAATRAWRDGADADWVTAALLHDIGDIYAPYNHDEYAAAILRPFVREQVAWTVEKHGAFQMAYYAHHVGGDRDAREKHRGAPYFDDCAAFCERWDQASFDPDYPSLPLADFAETVRRVFGRKPYDPAVIRAGERVPLEDAATAATRA
jgi:predicted HD phosphohydrolase